MSAGTKVTIAVVVLFGAMLGVYYGFGGPDGMKLVGLETVPPAERDLGATGGPAALSPETGRSAPPWQSGGYLTDSVEQATGGGEPVDNPFAGLASQALTVRTAPGPKTAPILRQTLERRTPSPLPGATPAPAAAKGVEYVVQEDDSLWTIAEAWLGDGTRWQDIADLNPAINPDRLRVGQRLRLPATAANSTMKLNGPVAIERRPRKTRVASASSHTIRSGETLSTIAQRYYGTATAWRRIFDANRATIGRNPDRLVVGTRLVIPKN